MEIDLRDFKDEMTLLYGVEANTINAKTLSGYFGRTMPGISVK
jgi:hypothetical protein